MMLVLGTFLSVLIARSRAQNAFEDFAFVGGDSAEVC